MILLVSYPFWRTTSASELEIYMLTSNQIGVVLFFTAASAMFVGVQIMFEVRESEARRGVCLKC